MYSTTRLVEIWIEPPFVVACGCKVSVYHPVGPANWVGDLWWKGTLVSNVEPRLPKSWGLLASLYPVYSCFSALVKHCTTVQVNLFHFPTSWFENALLLSAYQHFWCISFWLYCIRAFNSSLHAHLFRFCLSTTLAIVVHLLLSKGMFEAEQSLLLWSTSVIDSHH